MNKIVYKQRSDTTTVYIVYKDLKADFSTVYKKARRAGEYDTGYHYYIERNGNINFDRSIDAVAQYDFKDNEISVYVLVDAVSPEDVTDAQKKSLLKVTEFIEKRYKTIKHTKIGKTN